MAKIVSEQEKAKKLLTLTTKDVNPASFGFLCTVKGMLVAGTLSEMSDKQQTWFDDLYDKHFADVGGNDGS